MSEILQLISALAAGSVLGYAYFYGLWWTVQQMTAKQHPYRFMLASFLIRLIAVMIGFYLLLSVGWPLLAMGLLGFIAVRMVLIRKWGLNGVSLDKELDESDGI